MHEDWKACLSKEKDKPYFLALKNFLASEKAAGKTIYPSSQDMYHAFDIAPQSIKVVILGQDPYHGANQAHGLSFSVLPGVKPPPSLVNIYKEITNEYGYEMNQKNGYLQPWADQGVMLLNSVLSVEAGLAASHQGRGWEIFTSHAIEILGKQYQHIVFMLWGAYARSKKDLIDDKKHLVLTSPHPSPFSAYQGFFGNNHFSRANEYLVSQGKSPIDWKIT